MSQSINNNTNDVSALIAQRLIQEYGAWEAPKIAAAIFQETVKEVQSGLGNDQSQPPASNTSIPESLQNANVVVISD